MSDLGLIGFVFLGMCCVLMFLAVLLEQRRTR